MSRTKSSTLCGEEREGGKKKTLHVLFGPCDYGLRHALLNRGMQCLTFMRVKINECVKRGKWINEMSMNKNTGVTTLD